MPIEIKPAGAPHRDAMRELRNDPEALFWSGDRAPIGCAEHAVWFEAALLQPERHYILVAVEGSQVVGYGRFEVKTTAHVSFAIEAPHRRQGYGSMLLDLLELEAARRQLPELSARCHPGNLASLGAFMRAGYHLDAMGWQSVSKAVPAWKGS